MKVCIVKLVEVDRFIISLFCGHIRSHLLMLALFEMYIFVNLMNYRRFGFS